MGLIHKQNNNRRLGSGGFILLLAILLSTVLFSIGVAFSTIVYKELILSFTARESQISFYAADVGIECVKYWDNITKDPRFGPGVFGFDAVAPFEDDSQRVLPEDIGKIECGGTVHTIDLGGSFDFVLDNFADGDNPNPNDYCASIAVTKDVVQGSKMSNVRSWGFNNCNPDYPRRTDRALEATYSTL